MFLRPAIVATFVISTGLGAQTPTARPDTEVFLAPLAIAGGQPSVGAPVNISGNPGYDNQPSFTPDGQSILFTTFRGSDQPEIYRYDIGTRTLTNATSTKEGEYSPAITPDGRHFSVIRVEADGTQRLWQFPLAGGAPTVVLERVTQIGYHAWIDARTLVLFVLGDPQTLQVADTSTGTARVVGSNPGRSLHRIPGRTTASFVQRRPATPGGQPGTPVVMELDPRTGLASRLIDAAPGSTDADSVWTPDGWLLMASGATIHGWKLGTPPAWKALTDLSAAGVRGISRLAVSPQGDRIAFVALPPAH